MRARSFELNMLNVPFSVPGGDTTAKWRALVMRLRIPVLSVAVLLMPLLTLAQGAKPATTNPAAKHVIATPEQLVWKLILPGTEMAVVSGDPDKKGGIYVIRLRTKGEVKVT